MFSLRILWAVNCKPHPKGQSTYSVWDFVLGTPVGGFKGASRVGFLEHPTWCFSFVLLFFPSHFLPSLSPWIDPAIADHSSDPTGHLPTDFSSDFRVSVALSCTSAVASIFESVPLALADFDNSDSEDFWDNWSWIVNFSCYKTFKPKGSFHERHLL